jgi:hypothetical protein
MKCKKYKNRKKSKSRKIKKRGWSRNECRKGKKNKLI